MHQTKLASANRDALLRQLSASIGEINQPVCAVVMNAEAALRLLIAQPTDTEAVRGLLACIVNDGMRTGDIVNYARALIKESAATGRMPGDQRWDPRGHRRNPR
jgi:C4-dicarboxylate-specific signal transduction histidine kinase